MKLVTIVLMMFIGLSCFAGDQDVIDEDEKNPDPWIGLNKVTHGFNDKADRFFLKPIAKGYAKITPVPIRKAIRNFFSNLGDIENGVNNLLQGKVGRSAGDFTRLLVNTTIGIGGLFDPATKFGLEKNQETFGQTLTVWGVPQGPYVVLPFFGPHTLTDALTNPLNPRLDPLRYLYPVSHRNTLWGIEKVVRRADLLTAESVVFGDRYIFIRDAYLQRRDYLVHDGQVEDDFDDF